MGGVVWNAQWDCSMFGRASHNTPANNQHDRSFNLSIINHLIAIWLGMLEQTLWRRLVLILTEVTPVFVRTAKMSQGMLFFFALLFLGKILTDQSYS